MIAQREDGCNAPIGREPAIESIRVRTRGVRCKIYRCGWSRPDRRPAVVTPHAPAAFRCPMIGTTFSHYQIIEKLGTGGMGEVYLAEDTKLDRHVAVKFVPHEYSRDAVALERFNREARAAAALNHPNIITVHDVGTHRGRPYIVMEHVDGELLTKAIERKDLTVERALEIASQMFEGLAAAHEAGVTHRDVKPDNILIDRNGRVRILDFGLAKLRGSVSLTTEHGTLGTVRYMSPEQAGGGKIDARSDLFSAGIVLFEMLAGSHPFAGEHREAVLYAITNQEPQPLRRYNNRVGDGIERIVSALLAKDAEERYPSAKAVLADLRRERGVTSARNAAGTRASHRRIWIGAVGAAGVLLAAGVWRVAERKTPGRLAAESSSIAVLPLVNMSGDDSEEYFSDGLSEELTNALVKIPELKVAGRTSAFSFKGRNEDLRTIGEELGVEHLLEGSVRKSGKKVRITVQLVKAADGFRVWTQTYDRTLDDIFTVQDDIARSVARKLQVTLLSNSATAPKPAAAAGYDLVLRARFVLQNPTPETIHRAREIMERALTLAP
ncbi:MAG TPA: serine/threonine-protein kinase, partial [Candidatus Krumholzibacteria bacterium]|nr:serine/threonine-protein kinase [Candidatus Krumholzibacteria bacterium]